MAKQDDFVRYTIRVPAPLYERLKDAAGVKSVNAEIVARLENSFRESEAIPDDPAEVYNWLLELRGNITEALDRISDMGHDKKGK